MHYIRFLKPPKLVKIGPKEFSVNFVLTVTTDLGDRFFLDEAVLLASVRRSDANNEVIACQELVWKPGFRAVSASVSLTAYNHGSFFVDVGCVDRSWEDVKDSHGTIVMPVIIPLRSGHVQPREGILEAEKLALRRISLSGGGQLSIWEDTGNSIAHHIWDAGLALVTCLNQAGKIQQIVTSILSSNVDVIELGTGCGLAGLAIGNMVPASEVLLTDMDEVESFVKTHNMPSKAQNVSYLNLDWTSPIPQSILERKLGLIIAADCIYNPDSSPSLVRTIDLLERNSPGAKIVIAAKTRHPSEAIFFDLMQEEMKFEIESRTRVLSPTCAGASDPEDFERIEIYIFSRSSC